MKKKLQYTKLIITFLLIISSIWITWSYSMATYALVVLNITEPMSDLSIQVCITIVGTIIAYCLKSYFETKAEKDHELFMTMNSTNEYTDVNLDDMMGGN